MCNLSNLDARDEMHGGLRALRGLRELLAEATALGKDEFDILGPDTLCELLTMVDERLQRAGAGMELYMPRPE